MKYHSIYFNESNDLGVARGRSKDLVFLPDRGPVEDWTLLELDLLDGGFPDYLASDLGLRLCSAAMRHVLESTASRMNVFQWLPVEVVCGDEVRDYWVLHFPEPVDALGRGTVRQRDFVVKPVLSQSQLQGHAVLTYPGGEGVALIVSERVKRALELASCTGFECTEAAAEP